MAEQRKTAVIIGAGPAGLTAALELLRHTDVRPIVVEATDAIGGISRTVDFNGYRMDIGGHRFFSKSDWVMDWWQQILPLERGAAARGEAITLTYQNQQRELLPRTGPAATVARVEHSEARVEVALPPLEDEGRVLLVRKRLSRIYFRRRFFDYPIKLNLRTITNLGPLRCAKAGASYLHASLFPRPTERSLEDFLVNRFGGELYRTFFKSYTEKVWGVPCTEISAEWGAQRVKGLSLTAAVLNAMRRSVGPAPATTRATPTSLTEFFLYPRLGPGQLWEAVAERVRAEGGEIRMRQQVERLTLAGGRVASVAVRDAATGCVSTIAADYVISTMPVKDLVASFDPPAPGEVARVAAQLPYRDFITVGMIVTRVGSAAERRRTGTPAILPDNWIYIQEPDVRLGRLQIFNNWSPALVPDATKVWLGLEYFCNEGDDLWRLSDADMRALAIRELAHIDLIDPADVIAATVIRVPKAYPAYFGAYAEFATIRAFVDPIPNLFLVGRNGMHRYNNQDHSMLTAKAAVDNIATGRTDKTNLWDVNVDDEYHEQRSASPPPWQNADK